MRLNIVTKTKMSAKELATTRLTVNANEVFKMRGKLFMLPDNVKQFVSIV